MANIYQYLLLLYHTTSSNVNALTLEIAHNSNVKLFSQQRRLPYRRKPGVGARPAMFQPYILLDKTTYG